MPKPLTRKQHAVLAFINRSIDKRGFPPTFREIGAEFGYTPNGVQCHIKALRRKGHILSEPNIARGIRVTAPQGLPLFDLRSIAQAVRSGAW